MKSDRRAVAWQPSTSRADAKEAELRTVAVASGRGGGGGDGHKGKGDGGGVAHDGSMKAQRCSFMRHGPEPCMLEWTPFVALPARQLLFSRRGKQQSCWRDDTRATTSSAVDAKGLPRSAETFGVHGVLCTGEGATNAATTKPFPGSLGTASPLQV